MGTLQTVLKNVHSVWHMVLCSVHYDMLLHVVSTKPKSHCKVTIASTSQTSTLEGSKRADASSSCGKSVLQQLPLYRVRIENHMMLLLALHGAGQAVCHALYVRGTDYSHVRMHVAA